LDHIDERKREKKFPIDGKTGTGRWGTGEGEHGGKGEKFFKTL